MLCSLEFLTCVDEERYILKAMVWADESSALFEMFAYLRCLLNLFYLAH